MTNMNLIGVFVTKLWPVQALACDGGDGGATKKIISLKFSNFGDIITFESLYVLCYLCKKVKLQPFSVLTKSPCHTNFGQI